MSTVPLSDELVSNRLRSAQVQFRDGQYQLCLKTLQSIEGDPKAQYDMAIVRYLAGASSAHDTLLQLRRLLAHPHATVANGAPNVAPSLALGYQGREYAQYGIALFAFLGGLIDESVKTLRSLLAARTPPVAGDVAVRAAVLLHTVTEGRTKGNVKRRRSQGDEQLISDTLRQHQRLLEEDATLRRMHRLAWCTTSAECEAAFAEGPGDDMDRIAYINNLGVVALQDERTHMASVYFAKAATLCGRSPLGSMNAAVVMYNGALVALAHNEFATALGVLATVRDTLSGSPMLWVRMAQAAFGLADGLAHRRAAKDATARQDALVGSMLDRLAFPRALPLHQIPPPPTEAPFHGNRDLEAQYIAYGLSALQTAFELLAGEGTLRAAAERLANMGGHDIRVLHYALVMYSYGLLSQGNYSAAVVAAQDVLELHRLRPLSPDIHSAAVLYAVEGLCHVGRPAKAMRVLQECHLGDLLVAGAAAGDSKHSTEALFVSLCVVHILRGSLSSAQLVLHGLVSKAASRPDASHAVVQAATLLQVFIELRQGHRERALDLLTRGGAPPP